MTDHSTAELAHTLHEANDVRVTQLETELPGGPGCLENAFDALKMLTFLDNIALELGILDDAILDFEGRRSTMIDKIESKVAELQEAKATAEARARLAGGNIAVVGGGPNRAQRRHPNG
jgi:hypothetical protein